MIGESCPRSRPGIAKWLKGSWRLNRERMRFEYATGDHVWEWATIDFCLELRRRRPDLIFEGLREAMGAIDTVPLRRFHAPP